ncbi:hypothetical protein BJ138DRAFT_174874 [Hygrophoropsis aurantiaca]|uniref:Uncharacterized protein n=1 Tax=Hygrophoropsis aurantiaca TaxID=72124 RepID=A0ACB8APA3_9AGAM|nr:hypothetical protein BJ138DRAFT_174874 [Hygrophoropsis aurantiaca]
MVMIVLLILLGPTSLGIQPTVLTNVFTSAPLNLDMPVRRLMMIGHSTTLTLFGFVILTHVWTQKDSRGPVVIINITHTSSTAIGLILMCNSQRRHRLLGLLLPSASLL